MANTSVQLEASWRELLGAQFEQPYMQQLSRYLRAEKARGARIFPPGKQMFSALNLTPVDKVKVVIIGQDPYHGPNQAHGLCFSVLPGTPVPPSLRNILKEIHSDLGVQQTISSDRGCLTSWAEQGVLLLNAVLSVEQSKAGSHQNKGWEQFTDAVVHELCQAREGLVFMLWGSYAQKKGSIVDAAKNCVLKAPHPSPLSAHRGFFGCKHFSKANAYLSAHNHKPIDWLAID
ncbi:MAG: uracil-DNA glycosylase [Pseudomonadaceae bacterium]|nr:uracil-DNA glycosylase [Pseudomonadaceae bacterium]